MAIKDDKYWNKINQNTVNTAKGFCPTMFVNYYYVGEEYTTYYTDLVTLLTDTGGDFDSTLVEIPQIVSPISTSNSDIGGGYIGAISLHHYITVYEQILMHSTDPDVEDSTFQRNTRIELPKNFTGIDGKTYYYKNLIDLNDNNSVNFNIVDFNVRYWGENGVKISKKFNGRYLTYSTNYTTTDRGVFWSSIPIFDTTSSKLAEQVEDIINGWNNPLEETKKILNTDWTLYIDGKSNPLYKLKWKCEGLKGVDTSFTTINIWVGSFNSLDSSFTDVDGTKFKEVPFNNGSIKFSYSDISKLIEQPIVGHNPVCIRVQLAYRKFATAKIETSSSMGCDLYYSSEPQSFLYDVIGYLTLNNGTWYKTTDGDGITFTVHDGHEGSDGYTEDNDNGYDDGKDNDEQDDETGDVSAGIGVLTSTFKMTKERLVQLGQFLWGANIFDKFSLVNNNPIENIISCKSIPINTDGTNQEIILGNVSTGVNGEKISNNFSKQTIGSILINEHYHNFLDYTPYTNVILYLPYIGFKELDTTLVMNKTIQVIYTVDAITGGCLAQVYVNNVRLYEFTGNVGIDIPITASNRAQVESGYIQAGVGATMSAVGGNVGSAVTSLLNSATSQYHYSSTGNPSPMCVASTNRTCYVIIDRPNYQNLKAFNHTRGRKCYLSKTINTLHGFTICDSNIDLSGINATQSELEELKEILSSGFYV